MGQTRIDHPHARLDPALTVPAAAGRAPQRIHRAVRQGQCHRDRGSCRRNRRRVPKRRLRAPEIGLTQHQMPPDEPPDPRLVLMREPDSDRAAAFRVLRHHLLEMGRPQVVIVSSPQPGDGKTDDRAQPRARAR